jgi:hypothetical protein
MAKEIGRFRVEQDEVGVYELEAGDLRPNDRREAGDIELVLFDCQDPEWPISLPRFVVAPLIDVLGSSGADAPPIIKRIAELEAELRAAYDLADTVQITAGP